MPLPGDSGGLAISQYTAGIVVVEITTDRNGKILDKRKYWKQPTEEQPAKAITPTPM